MITDNHFIHLLYMATQYFARDNGNPVLSIIGKKESALEDVKYPRENLKFSGNAWRAYYHCHLSPIFSANDHGHFHLFYRREGSDIQGFAHVASLTMDTFGQPVRWTILNRWVTDGPWLTQQRLYDSLDRLRSESSDLLTSLKPVESWLLAMLGLYRQEMVEMYRSRDAFIKQVYPTGTESEFMEERDFYTLVSCNVELTTKLSSYC